MTIATKPDAEPVASAASPSKQSESLAPAKKAVRKSVTKKTATKVASKSVTAGQKTVATKAPAKKVAALAKKPTEVKEQPAKKPKHKLVRDSFTMPGNDFQLIDQLKHRALGFKRPAKKSELLRAGLHVLNGLTDAKLKAALDALDPLKPGRPRKTPA